MKGTSSAPGAGAGSWACFIIREASFSISEKSRDKLYIPIQRTGNTEEAADVTLNLSTGNDADDLFTVEGAMFTTGSNGAMTNHEGAFTMQPAACIGALLQQMIVR